MGQIVLKSKAISVAFEKETGCFAVEATPFRLQNATPSLRINGEPVALAWTLKQKSERSLLFTAENPAGKWGLQFILKGDALTMQLGGTLKAAQKEVQLVYFADGHVNAEHILALGRSMGGCRAIPLQDKQRQEFTGFYQMLFSKQGTQLQLSYPLCSSFLECFKGTAQKGKVTNLEAGALIRHCSLRKLELAPVTLRVGNGFDLMKEYARENCPTQKKDFSELTTPGWNSWDYYRWTVTEDEVLENAEFIARDKVLSKHIRKIIVDDGWQYAYGEWEANALFPHGMKSLAQRILKLGMEAGLWVAPLIVEPQARIAQLHPEMLSKGEGGLPAFCWGCMERRGFVLDPTVEASRRFIAETFEHLLSYGFTYFKLDFLAGFLNARQFQDKSVPHGRMMDLSIGTVYRTVAGRAKILGCNYLFGGGPNITDAVRVGGDIHSIWETIKGNTISVASMFWANKRLWVNDPDFALCRSQDTANDPDQQKLLPCLVFLKPEEMNVNHPFMRASLVDDDIFRPQMEVLLSVALAAGGAINLSDKLTRLNESGLDLARRTVAAESGEAAIPLDLFSSRLPSLWLQRLKKGYRVLLINWEDTEQERTLDLKALGVSCSKAVNFWNDKPVRIRNGRITEVLPRRSCLFAQLIP